MKNCQKPIVVVVTLFVHTVCFSQTLEQSNKPVDLTQLKLTYIDGKPFNIADFKGKLILVDIWGQGCEPCVEAIPDLIKLQDKYREKLVILGINDRVYFEKLSKFIKKHRINYLVVAPPTDDDLMPAYYAFSDGKFKGFPYYALLDQTGNIILRNTSYKKIETYLK